jgi:dihydroorotase
MKKVYFLILTALVLLVAATKAQTAKTAIAKVPAKAPAAKAAATKTTAVKAVSAPLAEPIYAIVIKGGHVLDAKNNIDAIMDIAITGGTPAQSARPATPARPAENGQPARAAQPAQEATPAVDGKIALVAKNIDPKLGRQVVDARGMYVTPGLIDLHVHVFPGQAGSAYMNGPNAIDADGFTLRTGVTTAVDAGSSGWKSFELFKKQAIDKSKTRILAFLNIIGAGMAGGAYESNHDEVDIQKTAEMAMKYPQIIVGIKNAHYYAPDYLYPIESAIAVGKIAHIPIMLDGTLNEAVMDRFRPGDIFTHIYGRPLLDSANKVKPWVWAARKKGVIFDVGFGGSSFDFTHGLPSIKQGFTPNSISSDQHKESMNNAMKDMPNIMSLFMAMGMPFKDVITASTWNPAKEIQRPDLGNLSVGAPADVAIFTLREGKFGFYSKDAKKMTGTKRLECEMTIRGGEIVYDLNAIADPVLILAPRQAGRGGAGGGQRGGQPAAGAAQPTTR